MKKALLWIVGIVVCSCMLLWAGSLVADRSYAKKEWPGGLGLVEEVPRRFPEKVLNASAAELMKLSAAAGVDIGPRDQMDRPTIDETILEPVRKDLSEWNGAQLARSTQQIDATPLPVAVYLTKYEAQLDAIRSHLLRGDGLVWPSNISKGFSAPIPNLLGHMNLTRILVARSLEKSRTSDIAAWDELRAAWNLNRGLWKQPTLIEVLIALATTRMINAAGARAPLGEPAWFAEVREVDSRRAMLAAHQAEAWMITRVTHEAFFNAQNTKPNRVVRGFASIFVGPFLRMGSLNSVEHMRQFAVEAAALTQCDVDGEALSKRHYDAIPRWNVFGRIAMPNLGGAWQRLKRYDVELEATERKRQLEGGQPPVSTSRCSDGAWQVVAGPDGTQTVRFSRKLPSPAAGTAYPIEYTTKAVVIE